MAAGADIALAVDTVPGAAHSAMAKPAVAAALPLFPGALARSPLELRIAGRSGHRQAWKRHSGNKTFVVLTFRDDLRKRTSFERKRQSAMSNDQ
jgi:hypothetical protein